MHVSFVGVAALLLFTTAFAGLATGQIIGGGIGNVAPSITSVVIDDLDGTVAPNAGTTRDVVATATVLDANGFLDLLADGGVTMALVFGGSDVIAEANAARTGGSLLTGTYARTFSVPYYFAPGTYTIRVEAVDLALATDADTSRTFAYSTLLSADPDSAVDLGSSLDPGDAGSIVPLSVENQGNAIIDVQVVADGDLELDHLTLDASIPIGSVSYGTAADLTGASALDTSSPPTLTGFNLAVASLGNPSTGPIYFRLTVPDDQEFLPAGDYEATLTVTAVANS